MGKNFITLMPPVTGSRNSAASKAFTTSFKATICSSFKLNQSSSIGDCNNNHKRLNTSTKAQSLDMVLYQNISLSLSLSLNLQFVIHIAILIIQTFTLNLSTKAIITSLDLHLHMYSCVAIMKHSNTQITQF